MNTSNCYNKHLDLSKRIKIEKGIQEKRSFSYIADDINKSARTISYEILRNRNIEHCTSWYGNEKVCEKTLKPPYVCNACPSRMGCRKTRYYYYAKDAQGKYEKLRSDSRKGIDMTSTEFKHLNDTVSNEIRNGHSFAMIVRNHKDEFSVGKRTLYNYVENGYLDIINLDLPRKVRYKKRKHKNNDVPKKDTKIRINRTYEDFKDYIKNCNDNDFENNIVEMDTVEGTKGDSVLLTLLWRNSNFMLAQKLENKTSDAVSQYFCYLKTILGYEKFHELFPIVLTDNGTEFSNPLSLEFNYEGIGKTRIFYCNPGASYQKGAIEKNHEFIRYVIPKGTSMDNFTQTDITKMINHINSLTRPSLNNATPYDLAQILLDKEVLKKLNLKKVPANEIQLNTKLLKKN